MQFKFSLFDDEDLKRLETTLMRAMVRAMRVIAREGLLTQLAPVAQPAPDTPAQRPVPTSGWPVSPAFPAEPTKPAQPPEPPPEDAVVEVEEEEHEEAVLSTDEPKTEPARVPVFLRPPPEQPFPKGRAKEPPPKQKSFAKTGPLYQKLYPTMKEKPVGTYFTQTEAAAFLGDHTKFSGPISTWLQNKQLDAVIVTDIKPPTKGLPGRLLISKESLVARNEQRQTSNKSRSTRH